MHQEETPTSQLGLYSRKHLSYAANLKFKHLNLIEAL